MDPHFYWYLARASGVVAFGLVTLSTAFGLLISTRVGDRLAERAWTFELHKFASLLALGFIGLHMAVLLPDAWTHFRPVDLLVPGTSAYRPWAVALGVLAMYGSVLGVATFYVRKQIGYRAWRLLHYSTFATFVLAMLHGAAAGTDYGLPWLRLLLLGAATLVVVLLVYRFGEPAPKAERASLITAGPAARATGAAGRRQRARA